MKILGIIPAREGSKSIPGKNLSSVAGQPLLNWTIYQALKSEALDRLILSTDSEEILRIGKTAGAEVPFLRPCELAEDDTPGIVPILHAIKWLASNEGYYPDLVMCLQPTSPLRTTEDIGGAVQIAVSNDADAVVSVTPVEHHPFWMKKIDNEGLMSSFISDGLAIGRRQDLPAVYSLNGAIYLAKRDVLMQRESWYTDKTFAYVMPPERSLDVDTPWDLYLADLILRDKHRHEND